MALLMDSMVETRFNLGSCEIQDSWRGGKLIFIDDLHNGMVLIAKGERPMFLSISPWTVRSIGVCLVRPLERYRGWLPTNALCATRSREYDRLVWCTGDPVFPSHKCCATFHAPFSLIGDCRTRWQHDLLQMFLLIHLHRYVASDIVYT